ncbi:MAG TPA: carbamoyltransferase HypF [Streptosporangiaceae bacterium]
MATNVRTSIRVEGVVQGVGFRPFVYSLATRLGLAGWVGNDVDGVFAEVEGPAGQVRDFLAALERDAPPLARVERVSAQPMAPDGRAGFAIVASDTAGQRRALVSADSATCADCLRELADPADRRFGYPFINCTNCGPRFTIVRDVPYDRPLTTMAGFTMCAACAAEYHDPADRRFHAQPVCCPSCGPRLRLLAADGTALSGADGAPGGAADSALAGAVAALAAGQVLAVKGLGGYHLAVDAASEKAAALLRARKHREDKPFAVMAADLAAVRTLCEVDDVAAGLLTSPRRPIVLLPRRDAAPMRSAGPGEAAPAGEGAGPSPAGLAAAVAPGNRQLGVMLPYTPVHHLLLRDFPRPMVLTSGNVSDEPIAYQDADALARLGGIADVFLTHDRPIHIRTDDSVVRPFRGRETVLRRSRGYVPEPLAVASRFGRPVLACGAELKNTFCLGRGDRAFLSHHVGDLENYETLRSFTEGIAHFRRLFDVTPQIVAHDLHPDYLSTKYALEQDGCVLAGVQHHHAHIASCLADNGEAGPVIGVAFDGTGYGTDGTIWGGEFLLADLVDAERAGQLAGVPMPGGAAAIRQPWRMAAAYLDAAFSGGLPAGLDVATRNSGPWADVLTLARRGVNAPLTSSAGRLFDAVAALLGVRDSINYEGQAAVELEQLAATTRHDPYPAAVTDGRPLTVAGCDLVRAAAEDLLAGDPREVIGARFHQGVAAMIGEVCGLLRDRSGLGTVALSGGVFQNLLLLGTVVDLLEGMGFRVLTHSRVPPNDGGISLGQAVVAAARDRAGSLG